MGGGSKVGVVGVAPIPGTLVTPPNIISKLTTCTSGKWVTPVKSNKEDKENYHIKCVI